MKSTPSTATRNAPQTTPNAEPSKGAPTAQAMADKEGARVLTGAPSQTPEPPIVVAGRGRTEIAYELLQRAQRKGKPGGWSEYLAQADEMIAQAKAAEPTPAPTGEPPTE